MLKVEGSVAIMRITLDSAAAVPAAWLAASNRPGLGAMAAVAVAYVVARGMAGVINDIVDEQDDTVTAPWAPLPTGTVSAPHALATLGVLAVAFWMLTTLAAADWADYALGLCAGAVSVVFIIAYGVWKGDGAVGPALGGLALGAIPVSAWLFAGGGDDPVALAIIVAGACFQGFSTCVHAALRDVDSDPAVGNYTIATRFGPDATLRLCGLADLLALLLVLPLAVHEDRLAVGVPVVVLLAAALVWTHVDALARQRGAHGRFQRVAVVRYVARARFGSLLAPVAVYSIPVFLVAAVAVAVLVPALRRHERRVVSGRLREAIRAA